jgi:hypothetical protein
MSAQYAFRIGATFLGFYLIQILILKGFVLFDTAFCFLYVIAILRMPREFNRTILILLSFVLGLMVDFFYDTGAIHAAACVFMAWSRGFVLDSVVPARGLESDNDLTVRALSANRYLIYAAIMIFLHHSALFLIEAGQASFIFQTVLKIIFSTIFTIVLVFIAQYILRD